MSKTKVLETLNVLGFDTEEIPDFGYVFKCEGVAMAYLPDQSENCLRLAIPNIYEVMDDNKSFVMEIVNEVNLRIKYGKLCLCDDDVWVFYEHHLFDVNNLEDVIEHCLLLLRGMMILFHRRIEGEDIENILEDNEEE